MNQLGTEKKRVDRWRVIVVFLIMSAVLLFYIYRLFNMQIVNGKDYAEQADANRIKTISIATQRGIIYDRNGYVLARNTASFNVVITPANLPDVDLLNPNGDVQQIYRELSALIGTPVDNGEINDESVRNFTPCYTDFGIKQIVYIGDTNAPFNPVRIKCNIEPEIAMVIREKANTWPGVDIEIVPVRDYPTGELTAEVVGFLGPIPAIVADDYKAQGFVADRDKVGYAGIEAKLDDVLIGINGQRVVEVDGAGKTIRDVEVPVDPIPGNSIKLTIDTRLQTIAKTALVNEMNSENLKRGEVRYSVGVVIAMNPKTGEILSLVSQPTFENNRLARVIPADYFNQLQIDPRKPLFNHAISAEHPPGSVFKMATALGILNEDVVKVDQQIFDPGLITILQKFTPNDPGVPIDYVCYIYKSTGAGHGDVDYIRGIAQSCDVYFYKVGGGFGDEVPEGLGIWRIGEYSRAIGYGAKTGIELPGEQDGLIPDPTWKRIYIGENWSTGDTYISTIGQGYVLATPIQVLVSIATIANDGIYMKPTLIKEILNSEGKVVKPFTPVQVRDITKDKVIHLYDENFLQTDQLISVEPWVVQKAKEGMREVVVNGTASKIFNGSPIEAAGKTGTAEYCDDIAKKKNICNPGNWPAHAWFVGYAPYDNPEIVVLAFVYNGDEGSVIAAPIARKVMEAYFELKDIDLGAESNP